MILIYVATHICIKYTFKFIIFFKIKIMDNSWKVILERSMALKYHLYGLRKWKSDTSMLEKKFSEKIEMRDNAKHTLPVELHELVGN